MGMIFAPCNQGMYIILTSKFWDPDIYLNTLIIDLSYDITMEIPITFNIEKMPIFFEPNIQNGFDTGLILVNSPQMYCADIPNYSFNIKVINYGFHNYRLQIYKLQTNKDLCDAPPVTGRINVTPKTILIGPKAINYINITASASEPCEVFYKFRVEIQDQENKLHFYNFRFDVHAHFVEPEIGWSRKTVIFNYYRTHKFMEHPIYGKLIAMNFLLILS